MTRKARRSFLLSQKSEVCYASEVHCVSEVILRIVKFCLWQRAEEFIIFPILFCMQKNFTVSGVNNFTYHSMINFTRIATSFTRIATSFTRIALRLHATRRRAYVSNRTKKATDFVESEKNFKKWQKIFQKGIDKIDFM